MTPELILAEALKLDPTERRAIASKLLNSVEEDTAAQDARWTPVIKRRLQELTSELVTPVSLS